MFNKYILNFKYAFRVRKPILILRLIITFLGIYILRKKPLRYVDISLGFDCNLKCQHCFATALKHEARRKMTPGEVNEIVHQAMKLGAVNFSFQGGEPVLNPELIQFINSAHPKRNLISVTTNGTLFDEEKILELKKAGVDTLTISLDSAVPGEHDNFRGVEGSFEKAVNTVKLALKHGLNVTLGAVVSHQNVKSQGLIDLVELAHEFKVIIFVALAVPLGKWSYNEDIILTEDDREYLYDLVKKYPLLRTDFEANYVHWGCGAVKEILYLTPYGDVLPCPFVHLSLGNIFEENLVDIREKALQNPYFDHYHHLCLPAEDREFMSKYCGPFYSGRDGVPYKIRQLKDIQ